MTPKTIGACEAIDRQTIDCWRANYSLDKTPHELHALWHSWAPPGAVLALKAAVIEIERLTAEMMSKGDALRDADEGFAQASSDAAMWERRARECGWRG